MTKASEELVLIDELVVHAGELGTPSPQQLKAANQLLTCRRIGDRFVLQRRRTRVGAVRLGKRVVVAPPDPEMPMRIFLGLVYLNYGLRPDITPAVELAKELPPRMFREALGASLVAATEQVLRKHVVQTYVEIEERLQLVRGRPIWTKQMGRPRDGNVVCRYELKTTDDIVNQLILAGVEEARRIQPDGPLRRRSERQAFAWRGLASPIRSISRSDFENARARLDRQGRHYGTALALAEALLLGTRRPGESLGHGVDLPVFDLAVLFEKFVETLLSGLARTDDWELAVQTTRRHALVDAEGDEYRRIRPDFVIKSASTIRAVIDAKYKLIYTSGGARPPASSRLTLADAYQLYFYSEHLRRLSNAPQPLPTYVVAPLLGKLEELPPRERRTVVWQEGGGEELRIEILALPIVAVMDALLEGCPISEAAQLAPDITEALAGVFGRS